MVVSFDSPIVDLVGVLNNRVDNDRVSSLVHYFSFFFVYYCVCLVSIFFCCFTFVFNLFLLFELLSVIVTETIFV